MMEEKHADNRIINDKQRINQIDNSLSTEKKKLQKLDDIQNDLHDLNKNMSTIIDLLQKSIGGKKIKNHLDDMQESTHKICQKADYNIEDAKFNSKTKINMLYKEKDELTKEKEKNE